MKEIRHDVRSILQSYEKSIAVPVNVALGNQTSLTPMYASEKPPYALRDYVIQYPEALVEGYRLACEQYDKYFIGIVDGHKTSQTDYKYAPKTFAYQIDGPAYSEAFLKEAANMHPSDFAAFITARVFEFEPNIAAYGLNNRLWGGTTSDTWKAGIEDIRRRTGKKVAILTGTQAKLDETILYETGIANKQYMPAGRIKDMTGFDDIIGPDDLKVIHAMFGGSDSPFVFFGRTSMPKDWLRNPNTQVSKALSDPEIIKYIREYAITHNFDDPNLPNSDSRVIMDTKEALVRSGGAYSVSNVADIYSDDLLSELSSKGIHIELITDGTITPKQKVELGKQLQKFQPSALLSGSLIDHLERRGVDSSDFANGKRKVRVKPLKQHYGIYGHETGSLNSSKFLNAVTSQIKLRGDYILQPEFANLQVANSINTGESYVAIDRVFFIRGSNGELKPMESCRSLMPVNSTDGSKNNVHEGSETRCARIAI